MAGLYVHFGHADPARREAAETSLRFGDESSAHIVDERFHCVWVGHEDPQRHGPARDPRTGVRVVTSGRAVVGSDRAPDGYEGGAVNQVLLHRYLEGGPAALDRTNGAALIVVWDPRTGDAHLWTDCFGYHPAFLYQPRESAACVISTFPDAIARDPATSVSWDPVSMAEFLRAWRVTPPHTYFREVEHAGAATRWTWNPEADRTARETTWRPFDVEFFDGLHSAAEELAGAVAAALHDRTGPDAEPITCFVSGGADSRVLLFASRNAGAIEGVNLYDEPCRESMVTRQLCEKAGARYVGFQRDDDYYPRLMEDIVRWSGAMGSIDDCHYLGARETALRSGARTVMTACTTDWLFKGYGLEKTSRRIFGRSLPLTKLTSDRVDGFLPNHPSAAPPQYAADIQRRMDAWFDGTPRILSSDRDWLRVEDRRVRPACYAVSVSGAIMYRIFPYDTFLADNRIASCYERIRPRWKLDGRVWGLAATRLCGGAKGVIDANHGWRLGAGPVRRVMAFARGWIRRRLQRPVQRTGPATGSWPDFAWYLRHSETMRRFWHEVDAAHRDRLADVLGVAPWGAVPGCVGYGCRALRAGCHAAAALENLRPFRPGLIGCWSHWDRTRDCRTVPGSSEDVGEMTPSSDMTIERRTHHGPA